MCREAGLLARGGLLPRCAGSGDCNSANLARSEIQRCQFGLLNATLRCRSMQQCRESLVRELQKLAKEIAMEGSELNKLVTRTQ